MSFSDILGHKSQISALEKDLSSGNVAHAYLFAGPKHLGKFTVAKWFASQLLHQGVAEGQIADVDRQIEHLVHSDLFSLDQLWMEDRCEDLDLIAKSSNIPQVHRIKAKAKTDTIGIDDIRVLQERLHEVRGGRYRACLIRSAERMHAEAVNALLKILEEPPPGVVFLLTTEALGNLLPTLVSRARVLRFSSLNHRELEPLLRGVSDEERGFLLRLSQGAPGVIRRFLDDPDLLRKEKLLYAKALSFWQSRSLVERLKTLAPLHERGEESDQFLLHLSLALRDELPSHPVSHATSLQTLTRGLQTNVSRQMVAQRFAVDTST